MTERGLIDKWHLAGAVMADPTLSAAAKSVAVFLLRHLNLKTGQCNPAYSTLAAETGVDRTTAMRAVRSLIGAGYFTAHDNPGGRSRSNQYFPIWSKALSPNDEETVASTHQESAERVASAHDGDPETVASAHGKGGVGARKGWRRRTERVASVLPEKGKESGKESGKENKGGHSPLAKPNEIQIAFDDFNALARRCSLSICQRITDARRSKMKARLRDAGGIEGWRYALAKVEASAFLRGETGKRDWRAGIDFLLTEANFVKTMEGQYDDGPEGGSNGSGRRPKSDLMAAFDRMPDLSPAAHR